MEDMQAHPDEIREAYEISQNSGCYPEGKEFIFPNPDLYVTDGEELKVGKYTLRCIELRGHSAGLMAYFLEDGKEKSCFPEIRCLCQWTSRTVELSGL